MNWQELIEKVTRNNQMFFCPNPDCGKRLKRVNEHYSAVDDVVLPCLTSMKQLDFQIEKYTCPECEADISNTVAKWNEGGSNELP